MRDHEILTKSGTRVMVRRALSAIHPSGALYFSRGPSIVLAYARDAWISVKEIAE